LRQTVAVTVSKRIPAIGLRTRPESAATPAICLQPSAAEGAARVKLAEKANTISRATK
jgi:hypothetical protein